MPKGTRKAPAVPDVERAVLGAILLEDQAIYDVLPLLSAEDFYDQKNRHVYEAMLSLHADAKPIDLVTVHQRLVEDGHAASGGSHLTDMTLRVASAANTEYHALIVKEHAMKRQAISVFMRATGSGFEPDTDAFDLITKAEQELQEIDPSRSSVRPRQAASFWGEMEEEMTAAAQSNGRPGIPTGLSELDRLTLGWRPGTHSVIGAASGTGKSVLALKFARAAALGRDPVPTGYFSTEMKGRELAQRMAVAECRIHVERFKRGELDAQEAQRLGLFRQRLEAAPLYIGDSRGMAALDVVAEARRMIRRHGLKLIILDYLQKFSAKGLGADTREREIAMISEAFAGLAADEDVAVVSMSQIKTTVADSGRPPDLYALRGSGDIANDADLVGYVYRPERHGINYDPVAQVATAGLARLLIRKQRNGDTGEVDCTFSESFLDFEDGTPVGDDVEVPF